ncbi:hypothetical protein PHYBOEH_008793 [Phytophthora boehmeriae]|uniref:RxLR effector protein n=1 Tax=Phytophthora boehmeriae TaxID=109152 RepID=A0A8T1W259_9STRA|nr:hypothetical protein PHYBOEH_008793 [Phytophthora boehmeriae]
MRLHVLFHTAFILLALVITECALAKSALVVSPKKLSTSSIDSGLTSRRRLRTNNNIDSDKLDAAKTEDRGIFSSIQTTLSKAKEKASMALKRTSWVNKGLSDDEALKKLGMEGLSGVKLTSHPNYKYFQKFQYKKEGRQLDNYVFDDVPTYDVWKKLGLESVHRDKLATTTEYKT